MHGQSRSFQNIQPVDLLLGRTTNADADRPLPNHHVQLFAFGFGKQLGIIAADQTAPAGQDDGGCYNRTGQWTPAGFIQAGDTAVAAPPRFQFEFICGTHEVEYACGHPRPSWPENG